MLSADSPHPGDSGPDYKSSQFEPSDASLPQSVDRNTILENAIRDSLKRREDDAIERAYLARPDLGHRFVDLLCDFIAEQNGISDQNDLAEVRAEFHSQFEDPKSLAQFFKASNSAATFNSIDEARAKAEHNFAMISMPSDKMASCRLVVADFIEELAELKAPIERVIAQLVDKARQSGLESALSDDAYREAMATEFPTIEKYREYRDECIAGGMRIVGRMTSALGEVLGIESELSQEMSPIVKVMTSGDEAINYLTEAIVEGIYS